MFPDLAWSLSREPDWSDAPYEQIRQDVLSSAAVREAIDRVARESSSVEANVLAGRMFERLAALQRPSVARVLSWLFRKVWRQMYEGIHLGPADAVQMLREASQRGPVILLPTHKSHIDYLILSYVLYAQNLLMPFIAAGDNLNIPLVGSLLRMGGALFIRREFRALAGEPESAGGLYKAVFHEYVACLLARGASIECFIEGGRSRTGKLLPPKLGFLKVVSSLVASGRIPDVTIVPISLSYDRIVEGASYVDEMLGARKQPESLVGLVNAAHKVLRLNFGAIYVQLARPFSLRAAIHAAEASPGRPLYFRDENRFLLSLGYRVLHAANQVSVATSSAVVAAALLTQWTRGVAVADLVARFKWITQQIVARGGHLTRSFSLESSSVLVEGALGSLSRLLRRRNDIIFGYKGELELCWYRNQLIHWFISEALVACAMAAEYRQDATLPAFRGFHLTISKAALLESVIFLSQLLKHEFIYNTTTDINTHFLNTISLMIERSILATCGENGEMLTVHPSGYDTFLFLCMLVWPFVEVYWVACSGLFALQPDALMSEDRLLQSVSVRAESLYYAGQIEFYEALNMDAIRMAFRWFGEHNIIRVSTVLGATQSSLSSRKPASASSTTRTRVVQLTRPYQSDRFTPALPTAALPSPISSSSSPITNLRPVASKAPASLWVSELQSLPSSSNVKAPSSEALSPASSLASSSLQIRRSTLLDYLSMHTQTAANSSSSSASSRPSTSAAVLAVTSPAIKLDITDDTSWANSDFDALIATEPHVSPLSNRQSIPAESTSTRVCFSPLSVLADRIGRFKKVALVRKDPLVQRAMQNSTSPSKL